MAKTYHEMEVQMQHSKTLVYDPSTGNLLFGAAALSHANAHAGNGYGIRRDGVGSRFVVTGHGRSYISGFHHLEDAVKACECMATAIQQHK